MRKILIGKNRTIPGKHEKPILFDVFFDATGQPKPVVIFCHGYKGFKDWGAWNLVAEAFAKAGFFFLKFNFSHNGGTPEQPIDFPDLEAFGNDNYSKQLDDLQSVLNWVSNENEFSGEIDTKNINLLAHSRGGGIALIKAEEDERVKKVATWAGVSDFESRFPKGEQFEKWKKDGVYFVQNGRTKQQMPHYFQFYKDFEKNRERLNIQRAVENLKKPYLIVHGVQDETVPIFEAKRLKHWKSDSKIFVVSGANHVFGTKHPWEEDKLSFELEKVMLETLGFFK